MATKTISLKSAAHQILKRKKQGKPFSQIGRPRTVRRPARTLGELDLMMRELEGIGAGPKRLPRVAS